MSKKIENKPEEPTIVSYSLVRNRGHWSVATITTQGNNVVSIELSEPDIKAIAIENCKTKFIHTFYKD
jgi:hypothetical protein